MVNRIILYVLGGLILMGQGARAGIDGYYPEDNACIPCDSSCRTCVGPGSCATGEDYMKFNSTTTLGTHGGSGEYYDFSANIGRDGIGSCSGFGNYQESCFTCENNKILSLKNLECVSECSSNEVLLEGSILKIGKVGRIAEYYLDPSSSKMLELGTLKYPYRTMKSVTSEIMNLLSHKDINVTIYTMPAYIEDVVNYFINITNVIFKSHPNMTNSGSRSTLIPTEIAQHGISDRARFHLLNNVDLPVEQIINIGQLTDYEKELTLANSKQTIIAVRSGISFEDINLYREEIDYAKDITLVNTVYLQHLVYAFSKYFKIH